MDLSWSLGISDATGLSIYRDGELLAALSAADRSMQDTELHPNTQYVYRLVVSRPDDAEVSDEKAVATLAHPPRISGQMATHWTGYQQPIIDELNPDYTEYRVVLTPWGGSTPVTGVADSDWSTSKCRKIDGLEPTKSYTISVTARNLDGVETDSPNHFAEDLGSESHPEQLVVHTRQDAASEDPWVKDRVRDAVRIFGLTETARDWMNSEISIERIRDNPAQRGTEWGKVSVGHSYPGILLYEVMREFWRYWDGFPEPCDKMNLYTYRRDVAQFPIDVRSWYHSDFSEPFPFESESWRLYSDMMVGMLERAAPEGEDIWEILERQEYAKLWGGFFRVMEAHIPLQAPQRLSLFPPTIQKYFEGFMEPGEETTWDQQIFWYSRLAEEDKYLAHPFISHEITHFTGESIADPGHPRTSLPEPLRSHLREADRQMLVDFINTLEEIEPWEWRDGFFYRHSRWHIYRAHIYGAELGPEVGVELDEENLQDVLTALDALYRYHCLPKDIPNCGFDSGSISWTSQDDVREIIGELEALTEKQRRVLLELVKLERG